MSSDRLELPYGPLTKADFRTLAASYYDASFMYTRQAQARERGVDSKDYMWLSLGDLAMAVANSAEQTGEQLVDAQTPQLDTDVRFSPRLQAVIRGELADML